MNKILTEQFQKQNNPPPLFFDPIIAPNTPINGVVQNILHENTQWLANKRQIKNITDAVASKNIKKP